MARCEIPCAAASALNVSSHAPNGCDWQDAASALAEVATATIAASQPIRTLFIDELLVNDGRSGQAS
jgi:hypothetical protein